MKNSTEKMLIERNSQYEDMLSSINFIKHLSSNSTKQAIEIVEHAKAQIQQDIFALVVLDYKSNGFFVEFGATNGVTYSNSWLLEKHYGWKGILAEPGHRWQESLKKNRDCYISDKCVWKMSGESLTFNDAQEGGFSTIDHFSSEDRHFKERENGTKYIVETISLNDLLTQFNAPKKIDYLSIDTEGSEYEILSALDFDEWDISIITVEHNFTNKREKIKALLEQNNYHRVLSSITSFDDWYVKSYLLDDVNVKFNVA